MSTFSSDPATGPTPEELTAYVDGQLDAPACRRVELWLAGHPEAAACVEEHRQVLQTFRDAPVPEPTAARWEQALGRVAASLPPAGKAPARRARPRWRSVVSAAAAAALVLALPGDLTLRPPSFVPSVEEVTPIPVASADEVEIVSIDAADLKALYVGQPPLRGDLVLAAGGDVQIHYAEPAESSWVPAMEEVQGTTPILMVPMRTGSGEKP